MQTENFVDIKKLKSLTNANIFAFAGRPAGAAIYRSQSNETLVYAISLPPLHKAEHRAMLTFHFASENYLQGLSAPIANNYCPAGKNIISLADVAVNIRTINKLYDVQCIGIDRWDYVLHEAAHLTETPIETLHMGYKDLSHAAHKLRRYINEGDIQVNHTPALWHSYRNAAVIIDNAENIKPAPIQAGRNIDAVAASVMALRISMQYPKRGELEYALRKLRSSANDLATALGKQFPIKLWK